MRVERASAQYSFRFTVQRVSQIAKPVLIWTSALLPGADHAPSILLECVEDGTRMR
jgi:hypothetical protein